MMVGLPSLPISTRASIVPFPAYLMHISADANHIGSVPDRSYWPSCDMSKLALQPLQRSRPTYAFVHTSFHARSTQPIRCASTPVLLEGSSCMSVKFHTNRFPYESCQYGNSCWMTFIGEVYAGLCSVLAKAGAGTSLLLSSDLKSFRNSAGHL